MHEPPAIFVAPGIERRQIGRGGEARADPETVNRCSRPRDGEDVAEHDGLDRDRGRPDRGHQQAEREQRRLVAARARADHLVGLQPDQRAFVRRSGAPAPQF